MRRCVPRICFSAGEAGGKIDPISTRKRIAPTMTGIVAELKYDKPRVH